MNLKGVLYLYLTLNFKEEGVNIFYRGYIQLWNFKNILLPSLSSMFLNVVECLNMEQTESA